MFRERFDHEGVGARASGKEGIVVYPQSFDFMPSTCQSSRGHIEGWPLATSASRIQVKWLNVVKKGQRIVTTRLHGLHTRDLDLEEELSPSRIYESRPRDKQVSLGGVARETTAADVE